MMRSRFCSLFLASLLLLQLSSVLVSKVECGVVPFRLYMEPEKIFASVGSVFTVNVSVSDIGWGGLYAYEFKLFYDNAVLEGLNITLPEGHFLTPDSPERIWTWFEINQTNGYMFIGVTLRGDQPTKFGNGSLATFTFNAKSLGNCTLKFRDRFFIDDTMQELTECTSNDCSVLVMSPDVNSDGKVNILDIATVARAFGSKPGDDRWNPIADMDINETINILDVAFVAKNMGKTF
jgi:hypothetical protein